ncbi:MAG TPA: hypothetical protein VFX43_19730 [Chitinophagaceae bacterium]|nr:hypothetical protein [Chitinophagaceae bacterium]
MGVATLRYEDRILAATGGGGNAATVFESHEGVCNGGILFLLPALLLQGLLKTKEVYQMPANHYYGLDQVMLTLAFMALARIKNPEQLKQCKPGEIGRIIGLDRIPEVSCLRGKIKLLSGQQKAQELNRKLVDYWYSGEGEDQMYMYIDGHVRIYYGYKANLPVKYVSRQKICLNATTEYWVNDGKGLPVMMVMGVVSEKLSEAIEQQIIPQMQQTVLLPAASGQLETDKQEPVCTFIFDRESYEPAFFSRLWDSYRIAIISYRKNVKDKWPEDHFKPVDVKELNRTITMQICEQNTELGGVTLREIRRLNAGGHQTSIITTHPSINMAVVAGRMFGRWSQENFFKYMIADYDFDKMAEFGTERIDENKKVVNPQYRKLYYNIKKMKEKNNRIKADFYSLSEKSIDADLAAMPAIEQKQADLMRKIDANEQQILQLKKEKDKLKSHITLKEMPDKSRYNKLKPESKMLLNIIKMICYRAETSVANTIAPFLKDEDDKRMLVKQIIANHADIIPDYGNETLTITLHTLSAPRYNHAAAQLAELLTQSEMVFPNTNLRLIYKTTAP